MTYVAIMLFLGFLVWPEEIGEHAARVVRGYRAKINQ